jgi:hypothetical protein
MDEESLVATPDTFVVAAVCPWTALDTASLEAAHEDHWNERATWKMEAVEGREGVLGLGSVQFEDGVIARLVVEPAEPDLIDLVGTSLEPFTSTEAVLIKSHQALWRIVVPGGRKEARRGAKRVGQLMASFISAGACGIFMPGMIGMHSPRMIHKQTEDLYSPQSLANLFVGAVHEGDWMRTRGLTAFGLPELETQLAGGVNGAYFRLMDVAANMIFQSGQFPSDSQLQLGHQTFRLVEGPMGPPDEDVPTNGAFGVQAIVP